MGWKQAFGEAMAELKAIQKKLDRLDRLDRFDRLDRLDRLDDPTVGLSALHEELVRAPAKTMELIQGDVTGLREENREALRRQDRMISDLDETRGELRELLNLVDVLRPLVLAQVTDERTDDSTRTHFEDSARPPEPRAGADRDTNGPGTTHPAATTDTDSQGGTMQNTEHQPQPGPGDQDQDLALKNAIEAAFQGPGTPLARPPAATGAADPDVAHGVLLLKAAGVASAELIAHRDTWEWLAALAFGHSHFRTPSAVEDFKEGRVRTVLSGRSLIALLIELWNTRSTAAPQQGDWALAVTSYTRIAAKLSDVSGQGETIRIVLDDGLPQTTED